MRQSKEDEMGLSSNPTPRERAEYHRRQRQLKAEAAKEEQGARRALAEKIVSHLIDKVNLNVVRPGPDPEERECYDMAEELRQFGPELIEEVVAQLNVNGGCR